MGRVGSIGEIMDTKEHISDIDDELSELALALGYAWPKDEANRWLVLKRMASRAAHWRTEAEKYRSETLRQVEKEKLYVHQKDRIIALARKVKNLRRAMKEFMTFQVAFIREAKAEMRPKKSK